MRRAFIVEILRARIPIVLLAVCVFGLLRMALASSQEGEWAASEGQGLASITAFALILPVLALVTGRIEGELGAPAWMLARPLSRRAIVGFRMLADAGVLALAAFVARLSVGDTDSVLAAVPPSDLQIYVDLVAGWWDSPLTPDRFFERRYSSTSSWGPVRVASGALVCVGYGVGVISGSGRRRGAARALAMAFASAAFVLVPFVVLVFAADVGSDFLRYSWLRYADGLDENTHPAAWRSVAIAWVATAPVAAVVMTLGAGMADLLRRPSAVKLRPMLQMLAVVSVLGTATVFALLAVAIRDAPPLHRVGSSRVALSVTPVGGSPPYSLSDYSAWLQNVGEWHATEPWVRDRDLSPETYLLSSRRTVEFRRSTGGMARNRIEIDDLSAGSYEVCAQVDPPMPNADHEIRGCWRREAQARRIEATCVQVEIEDDTDHGTIEIRVPQPQWDGTCPPAPSRSE